MNAVAVFIGSFDPVHRGHLESAELALKQFPNLKKVVFLPNNPRRGKPDRSPLALRVRWLSFSMPIYNHSDWMQMTSPKIVCDTRNCDFVVDILRDCGFSIVGLVGSDIYKPPKLIASSWLMIERENHPSSKAIEHIDSRVTVVEKKDTMWQHLSSSAIRQLSRVERKFPYEMLDKNLLPYYQKEFRGNTLSYTTVYHGASHVGEQATFQIFYLYDADALDCVENLKKLSNVYFSLPQVVKHDKNIVHYSFVAGKTMFELTVLYIREQINENKFQEALVNAFVLLQKTFFSKSIVFPHFFHCDPSAKNIIYDNGNYTLVDFENCRMLENDRDVRVYYDRFLNSFEFYLLLDGFDRDATLLSLIPDCEKQALRQNLESINFPQ